MEQLLGRYCWIQQLHPSTADRSDLSLFRLSAWSGHLHSFPSDLDLLIVEPTEVGSGEGPPVKRTLAYKIDIVLAVVHGPSPSLDSLLSPDDDGNEDRQRHQRFGPSPSGAGAPGGSSISGGVAARVPVQLQLGPSCA